MAAHKAPEGFLTATEAAAFIGRTAVTVRLAAASGELTGHQDKPGGAWCFKPEDLLAWRGIPAESISA